MKIDERLENLGTLTDLDKKVVFNQEGVYGTSCCWKIEEELEKTRIYSIFRAFDVNNGRFFSVKALTDSLLPAELQKFEVSY